MRNKIYREHSWDTQEEQQVNNVITMSGAASSSSNPKGLKMDEENQGTESQHQSRLPSPDVSDDDNTPGEQKKSKSRQLRLWRRYDNSHNSEITPEHFNSKSLMAHYHQSLRQTTTKVPTR